MNKNTENKEFHINIGSSSILLIFVILCLVAFATLSIVSANADAKLSTKVAERTQAYYQAHNQATADVTRLDETLAQAFASCKNETEYYAQVGYQEAFTYPITDLQNLSVKINILYPQHSGDPFYEIAAWQVITTGDVEYENNMIVIP